MLAVDKDSASSPKPIIVTSNLRSQKCHCQDAEVADQMLLQHSPPHLHTYAYSPAGESHLTTETPRRNLHELLLEYVDILVSCLVVAPCVIAYWRGTCELLGVYLFPTSPPRSAVASFLIGGLGHFTFTITQKLLKKYAHPDRRRLTYYVVSRLYTALFAVVCVNTWRGTWMLCDWLIGMDSLLIVCAVTAIALGFLTATRTLRNLGAPPYILILDHKSDYFEEITMFKTSVFQQPGLHVLDILFSVFVIGSLVPIAWRGVWGIFDLLLFPHDKALSAWGSLMIGYLTIFVTFLIHPLMRCMCRRLGGSLKLIICDVYYLMTFFGSVNAWRGVWTLLDVYLFPDDVLLSFWLTHIVPFLLLAAIKCSNSILVRGVFIDGEGEGAESVDIPINYVRLHFLRERQKKSTRQKSASSNFYLKPEHATLGYNSEKDREAQSSLIQGPHSQGQVV
ncbi:hypothetical protein KR018_000619 [Drosophila ironensis]|nr:hypothetical protein KR018_000619 [Drosophila ironensis]